jgi:hypothetical protein
MDRHMTTGTSKANHAALIAGRSEALFDGGGQQEHSNVRTDLAAAKGSADLLAPNRWQPE